MKVIVMTGVSSGIGRAAAERLAGRGHRVLGGACDIVSSPTAAILPLNLSDLNSVRAFVAAIGDRKVDGLILNAGVQGYDVDARTVQGFERTYGINHLAHYLLARLVLPRIRVGGTIVFTSSGTHNPLEKHAMPPPHHAVAEWLAYPERATHRDRQPATAGLRAYSSSKLCNVMTARTLAGRPEVVARGLRVVAYDPGLTPGTSLVRSAPFVLRKLIWPLLPFVQPFSGRMNSVDQAGRALADLGDGTLGSNSDAFYCSLRKGKICWLPPSLLAQDDAACAQLWKDSAAMVGLPD